MTTTETHASSEATNIAQQVIGRKTPIAVAIAEYVGSLTNNNPAIPYIFGNLKNTVQAGVGGVLVSELSTQHPPLLVQVPKNLPTAQTGTVGDGQTAVSDEKFELAA